MALPENLPPPRTMDSLGWLIHGLEVVENGDDGLAVLIGTEKNPNVLLGERVAFGVWTVTNQELQQLERAGFINLDTDENVIVTDRGQYWHKRWAREQSKETV